MKLEKYMGCSQAARKLIKSDLVLKNAKIVNVFTDRVEEGNVAVKNGMIVGIGNYEGEEEIDLKGQYLTSGFIESSGADFSGCTARNHHIYSGSP